MKVAELYEQVAGLGFEKSLEDDDIFYQAANRALLQVNALRPAIGSYVINHRPIKNLLETDHFPIFREEDLCFEALAPRAYYFEVDGHGICYVEKQRDDGNYSIIDHIEFDESGNFKAYSGFILDGGKQVDATVRLRFSGNFVYSVKSVALYKYLRSDKKEDIPANERYVKYDLASLIEDFLMIDEKPTVNDELAEDFDIVGEKVLLLSQNSPGIYTVRYRRKPKELQNQGSAADDETEIDLDEELCALMVLNIGFNVWTDDEPEKAEYYLARYNERAAEIRAFDKSQKPARYITNNW